MSDEEPLGILREANVLLEFLNKTLWMVTALLLLYHMNVGGGVPVR